MSAMAWTISPRVQLARAPSMRAGMTFVGWREEISDFRFEISEQTGWKGLDWQARRMLARAWETLAASRRDLKSERREAWVVSTSWEIWRISMGRSELSW